MIISRKKYEKLNDDLIDAKAKVDDAKKSLDEENKSMRATLLIKEQRDQYKSERDTLIDDIAVLKANISRLERENERLRVKSDSFFERWKFKSAMYTDLSKELDKYKSLLSEFSQHIGNKPSSSTYKYFRAKLDGIGIEESE
ncbi:hypothetical protein [Staphylococcus saprophyticus]|uniref:hypothetical protein n=1 Tax=Staphylococcus saprophyticus TaxID=29385 RepID=UPI0010139A8A|nr:hypothetical protein [Staphylococcus saprophyticus]RXR97258.1 hypothetical protein EUA48_06240 [Staphylococcus saprophyticus]